MPQTFAFTLATAAPPVLASSPPRAALTGDPSIDELTDLSSFNPDGSFGMSFREITGVRVVLEWVARSWLTPRGALVWDPNTGEDIRRMENADLSQTELGRWRRALIAQALAVAFVRGCDVVITIDPNTDNVTIAGALTITSVGTFPLIVRIDKANEAIAATFPEVA